MSEWRFMAARIKGDGQQGEWLHMDLPLTDIQLTDVLSGPPRLTATIDPVFTSLIAEDGSLLLDPWGTVIWAEASGEIKGGGIYVTGSFDGSKWQLSCFGFTTYPKRRAYLGEYRRPDGQPGFMEADPLDVVRHLWSNIQTDTASNLGLVIDDSTTTPIRLGTPGSGGTPEWKPGNVLRSEVDQAQWDALIFQGWEASGSGADEHLSPPDYATIPAVPAVDAEPYELNAWTTQNLGTVIDELASSTPFDYHERHFWDYGHTAVQHELVFGYPRIGENRGDLPFILGQNIHVPPTATMDGSNYANFVRILGAGEGRDMVRAESSNLNDKRLRCMAVIDDKALQHDQLAQVRAGQELSRLQALLTMDSVIVTDSPNAPVGSWGVGDEIRIQGQLPWVEIDLWFRVTSISLDPSKPEVCAMTLIRSDLA